MTYHTVVVLFVKYCLLDVTHSCIDQIVHYVLVYMVTPCVQV